jgi:hypothetical protein
VYRFTNFPFSGLKADPSPLLEEDKNTQPSGKVSEKPLEGKLTRFKHTQLESIFVIS